MAKLTKSANPETLYRIAVSGKLASSGPSSAYIAGLAMGLGANVKK